MRYLTIVHSQVDRVATEDLEIGGQLIRAGEFVLMNLPAGNWDTEYVDNPEVFDVDRNTRGHLGFGYGVHQCIGQTSPESRCRWRSPLWRGDCPGCNWRYRRRIEVQGAGHLRYEGACRSRGDILRTAPL